MFNIDISRKYKETFKAARKKLVETNGLAYFAALSLLNKICLILTSGACSIELLRGDRKSFPETNSQAYFGTLSGLEKFCFILITGASTITLLC